MLSRIAEILRLMQLYAHLAHNYVKGPIFLQDHDHLEDLYKEYESDYDATVERIIGLGMPCNLKEINKSAAESLFSMPTDVKENKEFFKKLIELEKMFCALVEETCKKGGISEGTKQLIGELGNKSEKRLYKLKQRVG